MKTLDAQPFVLVQLLSASTRAAEEPQLATAEINVFHGAMVVAAGSAWLSSDIRVDECLQQVNRAPTVLNSRFLLKIAPNRLLFAVFRQKFPETASEMPTFTSTTPPSGSVSPDFGPMAPLSATKMAIFAQLNGETTSDRT